MNGRFSERYRSVARRLQTVLIALVAPLAFSAEAPPAPEEKSPSAEESATATEEATGAEAATVPSGEAENAESPAPEFKRPKYLGLRQREDWSGLADFDRTTTGDPYDTIKYVPLTEDGEVWMSFGGQARSRVESWQNFGFGGPGNRDDTYWQNRFFLHGDLTVTKYLRGFIQGKSSLSTDRDLPGGIRGLDRDELDIQNGFVDLRLPVEQVGTFTLRSGRQELLMGKQRLVSPLDWANTRRTFDGFSGIAQLENWKISAFYTQLVIVDNYKFNEPDAQTEFWGLYAEGKLPETNLALDLYYLALNRDRAANPGGFNGTTGGEDRYTFGGRVGGPIGDTALDYDVEGAYQTGRVGRGDIDAFMVASQLGYTVAALYGTPRAYLGFDYASGDGHPGGNVGTFNQLFPLGHAYLGFIDAIGRQNIVDFSTGFSLKATKKVLVKLDGHYFLRASNRDAVYNAGGGVLRPSVGGSQDVGLELDLTASYPIDLHLLAVVGYSHFFPGDFIEDSGSAREIDWGYLMLTYTF